MNIFDIYLEKIIAVVRQAHKDKLVEIPENLNSVNVDIPPVQFNCDISTNVAMVLAKINKKPPIEIASKLAKLKPTDPDYLFIREIILNSSCPTKKCSNPRCKKNLDMTGPIYNAFDVQFCCVECRDLSTKHVIKHWI